MNLSEIPPKLRWECRRGMLELDVLLGYFLNEVYLTLSVDEQAIFVNLLKSNDQDLFYWLTDQRVPKEADFADMIKRIKMHAKNRH